MAQPPARYWTALDGLRALAVVAVVAYHANAAWLPAGFLGVDIFFVISGFLITTLLLREQAEQGTLALGRFWLRRATRLLPALLLMLGLTAVYLLAFAPAQLAGFLADARFAPLFISNWDFVWRDISYFEQARPSLAVHLWSLAVEEQFYLVWPPLALVILRFAGRRYLAYLAALAAIASAAWMAYLYVPWGDVSRLYYGTDTHLFGVAVGSLLGCACFGRQPLLSTHIRLHTALSAMALLTLIATMALIHEWDGLLYRGGYLSIALITGLLVVLASGPEQPVTKLLSLAPLRWVGQRSYAIYLWHWPLLLIGWPQSIALPAAADIAVRLLLVFALAAWSAQFVEIPLRSAVRRAIRATGDGSISTARALRDQVPTVQSGLVATVLAGVMFGSVALATTAGIVTAPADAIADEIRANAALLSTLSAPRQDNPETSNPPIQTIPEPRAAQVPSAPRDPAGDRNPQVIQVYSSDLFDVTYVADFKPQPTRVPALPLMHLTPVLAIGDSVMVGAAPQLLAAIPELEIDAAVSKQIADGLMRIDSAVGGPLVTRPNVVVLHLGTNGIFDPEAIGELRRYAVKLRRLVVVNTQAPRTWTNFVNDQLARLDGAKNTIFVDWHAFSQDHPEWFADDGVHLTDAGKDAYVKLIVEAIDSPDS